MLLLWAFVGQLVKPYAGSYSLSPKFAKAAPVL
jgi:hypothetical protein